MIVIVTTPFVGTIGGQNFNMPPVDSRLDVTDEIARELLQMGVVARMETKIDRPPLDVKKKSLSGLSQVVPAHRLKMRRN